MCFVGAALAAGWSQLWDFRVRVSVVAEVDVIAVELANNDSIWGAQHVDRRSIAFRKLALFCLECLESFKQWGQVST